MSDKVILQDNRPTKELTLPSFPGSKVTIYSSLLVRDIQGMPTTDALGSGISTMHKLIKDWNFTDEDGNDLPVSEEAVKNLPLEDAEFLMSEATEFAKAQKKT